MSSVHLATQKKCIVSGISARHSGHVFSRRSHSSKHPWQKICPHSSVTVRLGARLDTELMATFSGSLAFPLKSPFLMQNPSFLTAEFIDFIQNSSVSMEMATVHTKHTPNESPSRSAISYGGAALSSVATSCCNSSTVEKRPYFGSPCLRVRSFQTRRSTRVRSLQTRRANRMLSRRNVSQNASSQAV